MTDVFFKIGNGGRDGQIVLRTNEAMPVLNIGIHVRLHTD